MFRGVIASDIGAVVRATTPVPGGRAGLAYSGILSSKALTGDSYVCGLQQSGTDRSNVAVQNVGATGDRDIVLRITVYSGDLNSPIQKALPDVTLPPGGFKQISGILSSHGLALSNGYIRVQRLQGTAPYYAYGVINDQANSDGSFIAPLNPSDDSVLLPAVVETYRYSSEVIVTNFSNETKTTILQYAAATVEAPGHVARYQVELKPGQQLLIPNFVQFLRQNNVAGVQRTGVTYAGVLEVVPQVPLGHGYLYSPYGVFSGARTSTPGGGGRYGVFYLGVSKAKTFSTAVWLYGLQQTEETRSNVALSNPIPPSESIPDLLAIELYEGDTGSRVNTLQLTLGPLDWLQINRLLADFAPGVRQGYARVVPLRGNGAFIAYAVINDGSRPSERTGAGAFIPGSN